MHTARRSWRQYSHRCVELRVDGRRRQILVLVVAVSVGPAVVLHGCGAADSRVCPGSSVEFTALGIALACWTSLSRAKGFGYRSSLKPKKTTCMRQAQPVPRNLNEVDGRRPRFVTAVQPCKLHPKLKLTR